MSDKMLSRLILGFAILFVLILALLVYVDQADAQTFAPYQNSHVQFWDNSGNLCSGCLLFSFDAGTSTPSATFADNVGTANPNPIPLDASGSAVIYFGAQSYKLALETADGVPIWTQDNVSAITNYFPGRITTAGITDTVSIIAKVLNGEVFVSQFANLAAAIAACGGVQCTVVVDAPVTISANFTVPSYVMLQFQQNSSTVPITVTSGTLTINGGILAAFPQQLFTGAGTEAFGAQITTAPVEWFGAVGDGSTDDSAAIQECLNAMSNGQCTLLGKTYSVGSTTLSITKSIVGIIGVTPAIVNGNLYTTPAASTILGTAADNIILSVAGTDTSHNISYNVFKNFRIRRSVIPTVNAKGLSLKFSYGAMVDGLTVEDSTTGVYLKGAASQGTGYIQNSAVTFGYNGFFENANSNIGFFVDSTDGTCSPSLRVRNSFVASALGHSGSYQTFGFDANGSCTADLDLDGFEAATVDYGIYINSTSSSFAASQDIFIRNSRVDGSWVSNIRVAGVQGSVNIHGGWENITSSSAVASPGIDIESSSHVKVEGVQLSTSSATTGAAIFANNSGGIIITGNDFGVNANSAIALTNTNDSVISNNVGNGITATNIVTLVSSKNNTVVGNVFNGTATNGLNIDSNSTGNLLAANSFGQDAGIGVVTNQIVDSGNNLVNNFACPVLYNTAGTRQTKCHIVSDVATLASGTVVVTFSGLGAFTSSSSFNCSMNENVTSSNTNTLTYSRSSASSITIRSSNASDANAVSYTCLGD